MFILSNLFLVHCFAGNLCVVNASNGILDPHGDTQDLNIPTQPELPCHPRRSEPSVSDTVTTPFLLGSRDPSENLA
jgi:hypothetical protein